ncbi:MAG: hypothetical protein P4M15_08160 [Alphaproteobacteria bacterium]|nr:hypothetical protein [Alphaproteobacteria bacterium]
MPTRINSRVPANLRVGIIWGLAALAVSSSIIASPLIVVYGDQKGFEPATYVKNEALLFMDSPLVTMFGACEQAADNVSVVSPTQQATRIYGWRSAACEIQVTGSLSMLPFGGSYGSSPIEDLCSNAANEMTSVSDDRKVSMNWRGNVFTCEAKGVSFSGPLTPALL